jgi:hypothetical protein
VESSERVLFVTSRTEALWSRVPGYRSTGPGFDSRALPDVLSGSGTGSAQPREYN